MVDKGPLLTSAIIFYLSIGAAIFQLLEEPNWKGGVKQYRAAKEKILKDYPCLTKDDLDKILEVVSDAADQGVTITGEKTFNNWNWPNAVIFAATVITTIGYGNIAPKTSAGRMFCIFYGLFGVPLCFTWISELGKFFGGRAKHFGHYLTKRGVSLRKTQICCTAIFLLWGLLVHLVIPPFIFMSQEGWSYIEGLYFSFVTLTTIGFGDLVAGVNPSIKYPPLYRYFVEVWIYLGLAWLSLFFNWKVRMVVEAHKALKKRRKRRKLSTDNSRHFKKSHANLHLPPTSNEVNIFSFLSKKQEGYSDLIKKMGSKTLKRAQDPSTATSVNSTNCTSRAKNPNYSKGCNDVSDSSCNAILKLERSPRQKRRYSFSDRVTVAFSKSKNYLMGQDNGLLLNEIQNEVSATGDFVKMCENKLDKETGDKLKAPGLCGYNSTNQKSWETKDFRSNMFPNANISFIDEDNLLDVDAGNIKTMLSVSTDEDTDSDTDSKEDDSGTDEFLFTTDDSDQGHFYERLVEEYSKDNHDGS